MLLCSLQGVSASVAGFSPVPELLVQFSQVSDLWSSNPLSQEEDRWGLIILIPP